MAIYNVRFQMKSYCSDNPGDEMVMAPPIEAGSFEEAAVKAFPELYKKGFLSTSGDIFNARLIGPDEKEYEILRGSSWLIDARTGKRLEEIAENQ